MAKINLTEEEWRQKLTPEQYRVLREKGTEAPGSGQYLELGDDGIFHCAACDAPLFKADAKFESTMPGLAGWPAFTDAISDHAVELKDDNSFGMHRTEIVCSTCGSHLGHLFEDDPSSPNGKHYCINCASLDFQPKS
jgi:peptide-methionine (R)-S-oxide reductase